MPIEHKQLLSDAGLFSSFIDHLVENDAVAAFLDLLTPQSKEALHDHFALFHQPAGNGVEYVPNVPVQHPVVQAAAPPLPSSPPEDAEPVSEEWHVHDFKGKPIILYEGKTKVLCADGNNHFVLDAQGFPKYVVESAPASPHKGSWVPISDNRAAGLREGTLYMSANGTIIPNKRRKQAKSTNPKQDSLPLQQQLSGMELLKQQLGIN